MFLLSQKQVDQGAYLPQKQHSSLNIKQKEEEEEKKGGEATTQLSHQEEAPFEAP